MDQLKYDRLEQIREAGLESARLEKQPWSDSYWPFFTGTLAYRYADFAYDISELWSVNARYLLNTIGEPDVETLSPAEKYDLLVGDPNFTLTRTMINTGAPYSDSTGFVEQWMGLCHGWAPASFMYQRPTQAVTVLAADGQTEIAFYPADIKALATLLWANGTYDLRFIGWRCENSYDGPGRPGSTACLDTNPGTWHLAAVNQIGVSKRSFVLDAVFDREVWNQPMIGYSYKFFNPKTEKPADSIQSARVATWNFPEDRFRYYRSPRAQWIVGVEMEVLYTLETDPIPNPTDSEENDEVSEVTYRYDLELDSSGRIIGGEWHTMSHPDFLWVPSPGAEVSGVGDPYVPVNGGETWDGTRPIPRHWRNTARWVSTYSEPLKRIVVDLIRLSREN